MPDDQGFGALLSFIATLACLIPLVQVALAALLIVFWIKTLMLCMREERGDDKVAWVMVIIFLNFAGALIYHLARLSAATSASKPTADNWLASGQRRYPTRRPSARRSFTTQQVIVIASASVIGAVILLCLGVFVLGAVSGPVRPTTVPDNPLAPFIATVNAEVSATPQPTKLTTYGLLTMVAQHAAATEAARGVTTPGP